ncbi:MAG TPA: dihydrolipoyl dehydrogenase [Myxococcota bacterium]|nr:dihydrolipoyl dehydrogenase [Myxococcota bacterium]HRY93936.1 dihydrolipoyl dehydrogenase [Myxococcota bacterium]
MRSFDVLVLGGGPGGYTAAIRAAQLGARVALVEARELGGTCTNRGCIPTKALAASAHLLERLHQAAELGIELPAPPRLDFARAAARRDEVVRTLREGIAGLLKAQRVEHVRGRGRLLGPDRLRVEGEGGAEELLAERGLIVAVGSEPARLPMLPLDGQRVVSSDEVLAATDLPRRLVVVGGGVIGCEFASIYRAFGVEVTVVELLPNLLSTLDPGLSAALKKAFRKAGVQVRTGIGVEGVEAGADEVRLRLPGGEALACDQVLVATGRRAATAGLGLEEAGLELERGRVRVDERMATAVPKVFAIGDAVGRTWLAHTAAREGEVAAANALGHAERMRYDAVPSVVFTSPELASVGLTPEAAKQQGREVEVGKFLYNGLGKALCDGVADGRVEIVAEPGGGRVLGGIIAGHEAGALIAELTLAVQQGLTARQVAETIHAHPTLPEMLMEAAGDCFGLAIHRAPARKR